MRWRHSRVRRCARASERLATPLVDVVDGVTTERAKPRPGGARRFAAAVATSCRPSGPAAPGRPVRRGHTSSTRALRCSRPGGERRTRGPTCGRPGPRSLRLGGRLARPASCCASRLRSDLEQTALDPIALRRWGNLRGAALLAAAEARHPPPGCGFAEPPEAGVDKHHECCSQSTLGRRMRDQVTRCRPTERRDPAKRSVTSR